MVKTNDHERTLNEDSLRGLRKLIEDKADIRMVLEKVGRSEYDAQVKKVENLTSTLLETRISKTEFKALFNKLREAIHADNTNVNGKLTDLQGHLDRVQEANQRKATKSDVVDLAAIINKLPKVDNQLQTVKQFVQTTVAQETQDLLDNMVDRTQLHRSLATLVRQIRQEIVSKRKHECDSCATVTGLRSGKVCMSCAQHRPNTETTMPMPTFRKSGGFQWANPVPVEDKREPEIHANLQVQEALSYLSEPSSSLAIHARPRTSEGGIKKRITSRRPATSRSNKMQIQAIIDQARPLTQGSPFRPWGGRTQQNSTQKKTVRKVKRERIH
jgi:hypothetical protein